MAEFAPFDLARVLQTAEAIKGIRRQEESDRFQRVYAQQRMANDAAQEQRVSTQFSQEQAQQAREILFRAMGQVEQSEDPIGASNAVLQDPQMAELFKSVGIDAGAIAAKLQQTQDPEQVRKGASALRGKLQPFIAPVKSEAFTLSPGQKRFVGDKEVGSVAPTPEKPQTRFRTMNAAEIAAAGLPAGTSAQVNDTTGEIEVISKRDNTNTLSQKDQTTARMKLNTVSLARQQLNRIREEFEGKKDPRTGNRAGGIRGTLSAGPFGQGNAPTEGGRKFDAAVNQMRSTLTALTRVPGVGAMSDYETKLDQSKFPTRNDYESVTEQQIGDLDNMLNAIETGYRDLLSPGPAGQSSEQPAGPEITATGPNGEKVVLRNGQWVPK